MMEVITSAFWAVHYPNAKVDILISVDYFEKNAKTCWSHDFPNSFFDFVSFYYCKQLGNTWRNTH